jgi:hypothetical protein
MSTPKVSNHSIKTPKKKPKKSKTISSNTVVSPNFHSDEDEMLTIAWVSATNNPIVGVGQKANTFLSLSMPGTPNFRRSPPHLKQSYPGHGTN